MGFGIFVARVFVFVVFRTNNSFSFVRDFFYFSIEFLYYRRFISVCKSDSDFSFFIRI